VLHVSKLVILCCIGEATYPVHFSTLVLPRACSVSSVRRVLGMGGNAVLNGKDGTGLSALGAACAQGSVDCARLLVSVGAGTDPESVGTLGCESLCISLSRGRGCTPLSVSNAPVPVTSSILLVICVAFGAFRTTPPHPHTRTWLLQVAPCRVDASTGGERQAGVALRRLPQVGVEFDWSQAGQGRGGGGT
jgi:hypothetical protein